MIYLDSAATSLLKPPCVARAVANAICRCASPGRGSHSAAMAAADTVYACRETAAQLLGVSDPAQVVFTMNATHGLNIAIRSLIRPGDRVIVSGYEHNAVTRPLHALGANVEVAASPLFDPAAAAAAFRARLDGAAAVVCTHVSNVFGFVLPLEEIAALCRDAAVPLIVDAAQSAGVLPLDFDALGCEFMAMPGHKGLLGPQGTGLLLCRGGVEPLLFGGTGSLSRQQEMPESLPDRLEAGTANVCGIAGLLEGLRYVTLITPERIRQRERELLSAFAAAARLPGVELFLADGEDCQAGVLSVRCAALDCEKAAEELGRLAVAARAGLHCAPLAHQTAGTIATGTVRFSFSPFNTQAEMLEAAQRLKRIL